MGDNRFGWTAKGSLCLNVQGRGAKGVSGGQQVWVDSQGITVLECARERGKGGEWGTTGLGGQPRDQTGDKSPQSI